MLRWDRTKEVRAPLLKMILKLIKRNIAIITFKSFDVRRVYYVSDAFMISTRHGVIGH